MPGGDSLENVLVVPAFKFDLLSVSQITRQLKCSVNFFPEFVIFQDLSDGRVKGIGKELNGLYYLPSQPAYANGKGSARMLMAQDDAMTNKLLWHNRLGHPSTKVLRQLSLSSGDMDTVCSACPICPLAKQTRIPFCLSLSRCNSAFDLIHLDVWGPYKVMTHNGYRFFLTIVDDHSRLTWVYLLKQKK